MNSVEIGNKIRKLREAKNIKKNALANLAGVSPTYINDLESGRKCPTVEYLGYICQALGITMEAFFKDENSHTISVSNLTEKQVKLLEDFIASLK